MKYSLTFTGILIMALSNIFDTLDIPIVTDDLTATVNTLITIIGGLIALYGRWRRGDVTFFGVKK